MSGEICLKIEFSLPPGPLTITVKPVYSGHLRFLKKVSAVTRCPLYRVLDFLGKN